MTFDSIVIGLGVMGGAAVRELAQRGHDVLGLEQFGAVHDRGSSHGRTRIFRKAYFEHPDYVPLLHQAYEMWDALGAETGQPLFDRCGLMLAGAADSELIAGAKLARDEHNLDISPVERAHLAQRFPGFKIPDEMEVLYEADAGYLRAEDCLTALFEQARHHGATLRFNETVRDWSTTEGGVRVVTDQATYEAKRLVLTAGPWAGGLLKDFGVSLRAERVMQLWFAPRTPSAYLPDQSPVFAYDTPSGFFYGFPQVDAGMIKVAQHMAGVEIDDATKVDRDLHEADIAPVRDFVRRHVPDLLPEVVHHSVCMYCMSEDSHFVIDRHPQHENVAFAAGFSGHGFKFAPIVGEVLADFVTAGKTDAPVKFLGLERFGTRSDPSRSATS